MLDNYSRLMQMNMQILYVKMQTHHMQVSCQLAVSSSSQK